MYNNNGPLGIKNLGPDHELQKFENFAPDQDQQIINYTQFENLGPRILTGFTAHRCSTVTIIFVTYWDFAK